MKDVTIIFPYFNDLSSISQLLGEVKTALPSHAVKILIIDDGSLEQPADIALLRKHGLTGSVVRLKRNVGSQAALTVGLRHHLDTASDAGLIIFMDSDGEDPPEGLPKLLANWEESRILVASRGTRVTSLRFKIGYAVFRLFFNLMTGRMVNFGNFMCMSHQQAQRLANMDETFLSLPASVLISGHGIKQIQIDRAARIDGVSRMNFVGLIRHGINCIRVFREESLIRIGLFALVSLCLLLLMFLATIGLKFYGITVSGWPSLSIGIISVLMLQVSGFLFMSIILMDDKSKSCASPESHLNYIESVETG